MTPSTGLLPESRRQACGRLCVLGAVLLVALGMVASASAANATSPTHGKRLAFESDFTTLHSHPGRSGEWMTSGASGWRTLPDNHELQYYSDSSNGFDPFSVEKGVLTITAQRGTNPAKLPYNSGMLTTFKSFGQLYGYFEMKARLPAGRGLWPAFWLLPADQSWPPEIDVLEQLGNDSTTIYIGTHSAVGGPNVGTTVALKVADTSNGFHTYGVDWQAREIAWYFDGKLIRRQPTPADMHKPMYMLINLAVGGKGSWPGPPTPETIFPARFIVEYLHAYANAGE
jgi:beta-glucanase (GH16 family)